MNAEALVAELERRGVELASRDGNLICRASPGALDDELRAAIRRLKPELLALLDARARAPLSASQRRIHALATLLPDQSVAGNTPIGLRLRGPVDADALARTLAAIVARHDALRCGVAEHGSLRIVDDVSLELRRHDLRALAGDEREREQDRLLAALIVAPFDLRRPPLLRAALLQRGDDDWILALVTHVFAFDGQSTPLLLGELGRGYADARAGRAILADAAPPSYVAIASRLRAEQDAALAAQRAWWTAALAGARTIDLDADTGEPADRDLSCGQVFVRVPAPLRRALEQLARRERASLFHVLLAAWALALREFGEGERVAIGTIVSSRRGLDAEAAIGSFANNILVCADLRGDASGSQLIASVREHLRGAFGRLELEFEALLAGLEPGLRLRPAFRVMFVLHQHGGGHGPQLPGLRAEPLTIAKRCSPYLLDLALAEADDELRGTLTHGLRRVSPAAAAEIVAAYLDVLERLSDDPSRSITALAPSLALTPVVADPEREPAAAGGPPQGPIEAQVAAIWARLLELEPALIERDAEFFALGGHSLLALAMLRELEAALGAPAADVLPGFAARPTVASLARLWTEARA